MSTQAPRQIDLSANPQDHMNVSPASLAAGSQAVPAPEKTHVAQTMDKEAIKLPALPKEIGGAAGPEPTRYGDWQHKGRCTDF